MAKQRSDEGIKQQGREIGKETNRAYSPCRKDFQRRYGKRNAEMRQKGKRQSGVERREGCKHDGCREARGGKKVCGGVGRPGL